MTGQPQSAKILRLIARLNTGGPAIHTVLLTQGLNGGRFCSRLVTGMVSPGEGDMGYYAESRGVVPIVIPEMGRDPSPWNDLRAFWKLYRLFSAEKVDIIHTHTAKAGGLGRLAGVLYNLGRAFAGGGRKARLIHSFHGHIFRGYFSPLKSRVLVLVERLLATMTDRIIAVSEQVKRDLVEVYKICPEEKVTVIPLGLDFSWVDGIERHRGALRREFLVPPDCVAVGIIGRLTGIKNHRMFVFAAQIMKGRNIHSFIIGDGEGREGVVRLVREMGLEDRIALTGWCQDVARIYADLDIVCLTSLNEGTPVVLIEAMAAGLPFVATDVGGVRDLMVGMAAPHPEGFSVFANGILTPGDEPAVLAAALSFLVDRPELRREMGNAGRQWVRARYSHVRLLRDVEALYENLLASERSGHSR